MRKEDIINYVMETPSNTNPAILGQMIDSVEGGGNPNRVQTVTGTADAPFGTINPSELAEAITNGNASASYVIDASALGAGTISGRLGVVGNYLVANGATIQDETISAYVTDWNASDGALVIDKYFTGTNVIDISTYASSMPTELTVIWHPINETANETTNSDNGNGMQY